MRSSYLEMNNRISSSIRFLPYLSPTYSLSETTSSYEVDALYCMMQVCRENSSSFLARRGFDIYLPAYYVEQQPKRWRKKKNYLPVLA